MSKETYGTVNTLTKSPFRAVKCPGIWHTLTTSQGSKVPMRYIEHTPHSRCPPAGQFITPYIQLLESFPYQLKNTCRQALYFLRAAARSRFWHSSRFALARLWVPNCSRRGERARVGDRSETEQHRSPVVSSWASVRMPQSK